jgi:hypothetical protein
MVRGKGKGAEEGRHSSGCRLKREPSLTYAVFSLSFQLFFPSPSNYPPSSSMSTTNPLPVDDRPSLKTFQQSVEEQHRLARIGTVAGDGGTADELVKGVEGLSMETRVPEDDGREIKVRLSLFSSCQDRRYSLSSLRTGPLDQSDRRRHSSSFRTPRTYSRA